MKILIIGFLAFSAWLALSTYLYVCKIKGFCYDQGTMQMDFVIQKDIIKSDALPQPVIQERVVSPKEITIYFAFDNSDFISDANTDKYFDKSFSYLDQNSQAWLSITGHTDGIGTEEYNQALGYRRAQSLQHYFESKGMLSNRISVESMGEKEPTDGNNTTEGRANNRRTAITIKK
jgi:outer membrane protein OmpA-like peptidoglycan-associated protein